MYFKGNIFLSKGHEVYYPYGVLLIRDYIMDDSKTHPVGGALFSMLMLVDCQGTGTYSFPEIKEMFKKTKFTEPKLYKKGASKNSLIEVRKVVKKSGDKSGDSIPIYQNKYTVT